MATLALVDCLCWCGDGLNTAAEDLRIYALYSLVFMVLRFSLTPEPNPKSKTELPGHENRSRNQKPKNPNYRLGSVRLFSIFGVKVPGPMHNKGDRLLSLLCVIFFLENFHVSVNLPRI